MSKQEQLASLISSLDNNLVHDKASYLFESRQFGPLAMYIQGVIDGINCINKVNELPRLTKIYELLNSEG